MSNNCAEAIRSFGSYLEKFPYGAFSTNARYYKAECELKQGLNEEALAGFEYVSAQAPSTFTENSLLQAARLSIQFEYWEKALDHYTALLDHAENKSSQVEALEGITT